MKLSDIVLKLDEYHKDGLNRIAQELSKYMDCRSCPCDDCAFDNTPVGCKSNLYTWLNDLCDREEEDNV